MSYFVYDHLLQILVITSCLSFKIDHKTFFFGNVFTVICSLTKLLIKLVNNIFHVIVTSVEIIKYLIMFRKMGYRWDWKINMSFYISKLVNSLLRKSRFFSTRICYGLLAVIVCFLINFIFLQNNFYENHW